VEYNEDKGKIIMKKSALPGVDMSISDFTMVTSVKVTKTKVTKRLFFKGGAYFIGTKDQLDSNDVIKVGLQGVKYKVVKMVKVDPIGKFIHRVKRVDGNTITTVDINAILLGQPVKIVSRPSFQQMINYACSMREGSDTCKPCEQDYCCQNPAEESKIENVSYLVTRCDNPLLEEIITAPDTYDLLGKIVKADNGFCYNVVSVSTFNTTISLSNTTTYTTCNDCL